MIPDQRGRQLRAHRPRCPICSRRAGATVLCVARRSMRTFSYYYCPTPGCPFSIKIPRPLANGDQFARIAPGAVLCTCGQPMRVAATKRRANYFSCPCGNRIRRPRQRLAPPPNPQSNDDNQNQTPRHDRQH